MGGEGVSQQIIIPGSLPSMNQIVDASKKHWAQYSTMKKEHTEAVAWLAKSLTPMEAAIVRCTWICKDKRTDPDNIISGCKFILDGLVEGGVLKNDGWKEIRGLQHYFRVDRGNPRVVVELCPPGN